MYYLSSLGQKGIPTQRMLEKNYVSKLNDFTVVPSVDDAVTQYEGSGGNLTVWSDFGLDLLSSNANLLRGVNVYFIQSILIFLKYFIHWLMVIQFSLKMD